MTAKLPPLNEWSPTRRVALSIEERDALLRIPGLTIVPSPGETGTYDITPGSTVGVANLAGIEVRIRPKIDVKRLMFILSYAMDPQKWSEDLANYAEDIDVFEAILPAFVAHLRRATRRGLLYGYQVVDEALSTVRGRIRINDQIRRHYDFSLPVEVRYDQFSMQIPENQLVKAALAALRRLTIRSDHVRASLRAFELTFSEVELLEYRGFPLPDVQFTRLNEHYRPAVELSKLILRSFSYELTAGDVVGASFLVDMNKAFENFVVVALREALGLGASELRQGRRGLYLDKRRHVPLKPDIAWWRYSRCEFVGDAKYKRTAGGIPNADIYQVLAYATAAELPGGLLIYAKGELTPTVLQVVGTDKSIHIVALDLDVSPNEVIEQIRRIADLMVTLRDQGRLIESSSSAA
jgi:5-methylcytosine-specific restriction enzyme subunit McrC